MPNPISRAWNAMTGKSAAPVIQVEESATFGSDGPPAGTVLAPNRRTRETHPLIGADVKQVHSALLSAFDGRPSRLMDLYDDMRDRDGRLNSVCATRTLTLQSKEWVIKPSPGFEDNAEAIADAEWATRKLHAIHGFPQFIGDLADGILRAYSVNECEWHVDREGDHVPKRYHWRHPNRFIFTDAMELRFYDFGHPYNGTSLDAWGPDKFVVHQPRAGRASYPTRRGALLSTVFPTLTKRYGVRWWLKAAERWGQPLPVLKMGAGSGADKAEDGLAMLRSLTANWAGVLWGDVTFESVPGSGNVNPAVYSDLRSMADLENAIAVLGQNLTTEVSGGSFAAETGHELVRMDLLSGDALEMQSTIRDQVLEPLFRYNRPGHPVPQFKFILSRKKPITQMHVTAGAVSKDDLREDIGRDPVPDGKGADLIEPAATGIGLPSFGEIVGEPVASKPDATATPAPAEPPPDPEAKDAGAALNGAQVTALKEMILAVATGEITKITAEKLIVAAFPLSETEAADLLDDVAEGSNAPEASGGASNDDPFPGRTGLRMTSTSPTSGRSMSPRGAALYRALVAQGHSRSSDS